MQPVPAITGFPPAFVAGFPDQAPTLRTDPEPRLGVRRAVGADAEVFAEGDRAAFIYKVVSGAVRTFRLLSDGRRQIDAFHLPGEFFGFAAGEEHRFGAEAVTDTRVVAYRRERGAPSGGDGSLAREVTAAMRQSLERARDHLVLLGRKSARERIASFLLGFSERTSERGGPLDLPMSRTDIADHLGLTVESVSRALTQLERDGLIGLQSGRRAVILRNTPALCRIAA